MPFYPPVPGTFAKIDRFVVLMLENRSFDHLLGLQNTLNRDIDGVSRTLSNFQDPSDPNSPQVFFSRANAYAMPFDPRHEFSDVALQLHAPFPPGVKPPTMGGFVFSALEEANSFNDATRVMEGFQPDQLPVLTKLAQEFAVFNYWFSSLPGPTWPNRFFVHAGTSGGLTNSPSTQQILEGFSFPGGTIYQQLRTVNREWRIYHDGLPQAAGVNTLRWELLNGFSRRFREFENFASDAKASDLPEYTFIEPNYDTGHHYVAGNSMHPLNDIRKGEQLLKEVYESIRNSPLWNSTMLIVTFDEHGGFYDHVVPPAVDKPGDVEPYTDSLFLFDRLGVRVPALAISAYTQPGSVIGMNANDPRSIFDHTSILKTVEQRFLLPALTLRDSAANSLEVALNLASPRMDAPTSLPDPVNDSQALLITTNPAPTPTSSASPLSDNQQTLVDLGLRIKMDLEGPDLHATARIEHSAVLSQADAAVFLKNVEAQISARRARMR